jgi:hypothetical protein
MVEGAETGRAVLVGTNVVSLGVYPGTEERIVRVKIRNDGAGELKIEGVVLTCDCLRVDGYPQRVVAGKTGDVLVAVKKNELSGPFRRVFHVRTDDPSQRIITITVEGTATPPGFRMVPEQVTLCETETEATRQFLIVLDGAQSPDKSKLKCHSSPDGVVFHSVLSKGGNGFLVDVTFPPDTINRFRKAKEGMLAFSYFDGPEVAIPVSLGR